jgi:hypothetical protein
MDIRKVGMSLKNWQWRPYDIHLLSNGCNITAFRGRNRPIVECFRKVAVHLDLWGAAQSLVYRDRPRTANELKKLQ